MMPDRFRIQRPLPRTLATLIGACAVAACNQVYELRNTQLVDGASPDASPTCPQPGETPVFASTLRQAIAQSCGDYTLSAQAGLAVAVCDGAISEAPIGAPLSAVAGIPGGSPDEYFQKPRLTPAADRLIVRRVIVDPPDEILEIYDRDGDAWQYRQPATELGQVDWVSNLVPSAAGYRLLTRTSNAPDQWLDEWEYTGTWQRVRRTNVTELGLSTAVGPMLTHDGLAVVIHAIDPLYRPFYADRASQDDPFGLARPLVGLPTPRDFTVSIAPGCTGAYVAGLDAIFFARQQ